MIQDLLSEDNVSFHYPAETWEDVIRHGGQLMVDAGFTEPSYTEAMVEVVREMGPYIVLAPGLAMPHALYLSHYSYVLPIKMSIFNC